MASALRSRVFLRRFAQAHTPKPEPTFKSPLPNLQTPLSASTSKIYLRNRNLFNVVNASGEESGPRNHAKIPGEWLREMCACSECRNQDTQQRNINVLASPNMAEINWIDREGPEYKITFMDGHVVSIHEDVISRKRNPSHTEHLRQGNTALRLWDSTIAENPPRVSYEDVQAGTGMKELTATIRKYGFALVEGVPVTPEASQSLLESIGPIRNTHYGGFYDFTADLASKDTAYTSEALEPHTDNTYFTEPAGLQALHMLSHTDGSGGESILVDGFNAANVLFEKERPDYRELSKRQLSAHASGNEGISIQGDTRFTTFRHHPTLGHLLQVRWNNADRASIHGDWKGIYRWYQAARKFHELLNSPQNTYVFQLKPGTMLIFDNWRVLHGRTAFTGKRRMCGGYINRDDWISRYRTLNLTEEEMAQSTVTG